MINADLKQSIGDYSLVVEVWSKSAVSDKFIGMTTFRCDEIQSAPFCRSLDAEFNMRDIPSAWRGGSSCWPRSRAT